METGRKKGGRPKSEETVVLGYRLSIPNRDRLAALATKDDVTMAKLASKAVVQYLDKRDA